MFIVAVCYLNVLTMHAVSQTPSQSTGDGPDEVSLGDVFQRGAIKIEDADLSKFPGLPVGYVAYNGKAFRITTEAVAVGPYTVGFSVKSVAEEQVFKTLRILHAEQDNFDPDAAVWVDRTAALPKASGPDFTQRKLYAYSDELELGVYVIARQIENVPANTAEADLEVVTDDSFEPVTLPADLTFKTTIRNRGPNVATDAGAILELPNGDLVSANASQGSCKPRAGRLYCKLGQIEVSNEATVTVVMKPGEYLDVGPTGGWLSAQARVSAREIDNQPENNYRSARVKLLPNPNCAPLVRFEKRQPDEQLLDQGDPLVLEVTATDPDGSVTSVEINDTTESPGFPKKVDDPRFSLVTLGFAKKVNEKSFSFVTKSLSPGLHFVAAVATDNNGRRATTMVEHIFVNGPAKLRILEPKPGSLIRPGTALKLVVEVNHSAGLIKEVEFLADGISLGKATPIGNDLYELKLDGLQRALYHLQAVAIDMAGSLSKSPVVVAKVSHKPTVIITRPVDGMTLIAPANLNVVLSTNELDGDVQRVEIYANDVLIEEGPVLIPGKYSCGWRNVPAGRYTLKAKVIDNIGVVGESRAITVVIKDREN
ncbi:MAG TPA: Ig-like domain-containing protein [Pyrinomonadaceae bacterium]|nr:Ig-like domain-containing protein [Pyrinomonadaceae bacterium]